jgi:hypothetical protein
MSDFTFKPKRNKHLCCPPFIDKMDINSPTLIYRFPCRIKLAMNVRSAIGSSNHTQCYTVANEKLNAYGKWAGCPGGSGPGYTSTMRFNPGELSSGLGPFNGGSVCNCAYRAPLPLFSPANTVVPDISGNTIVGSTLTLISEGIWIGNPSPTFMYQWLRNGVEIGGATSITYVTLLTDVGQQITCRVRGTNSLGSVDAISNAITPILGPPQTVTFTGTVNFETIYVNSLNQVVVTGPVLGGFTIYRVTSTSAGASYVINSNSASTPISFLIVGGGGTGSGNEGADFIVPGAGGAGGFRDSSGTTNTATTYLIYVGRGGVVSSSTANGEDSLLQLTSGTLTAVGGGGGGNFNTNLNGRSGGSGGGGALNSNNNNFGTGGSGTTGQGFSGADGLIGVQGRGAGGGAGGAGSLNGGGPGLSSTITGQSIFYAGGGGSPWGGVPGGGGIGGGGSAGLPGINGLGGGGGGRAFFLGTSGGSGVVILRIPSFV